MDLRTENPADVDAVRALHDLAFATPEGGRTVESRLLDALREDEGWVPELSVVAELDGVVGGHGVSTLGAVGTGPTAVAVLGLGPVGVLPEHQGVGIGRALVQQSLRRAGEQGFRAVCLLGDPAYYGRFGFTASTDLGITSPEPAWARYFQALALADRTPPTGAFRYATPFETL